MGTPLSEHFKNQTLLQDTAAPLPVQDVGALLTTENAVSTDDRFKVVTQADLATYSSYPITHAWLTAYFSQDLEAENAVIIRYDDTPATGDASVGAALDDAWLKGAQYYIQCYSGNSDADIPTQEAIAAWVKAAPVDIQALFLTNDPNAWKVSGDTTSIRYKLREGSFSRSVVLMQPTGTVGGIDLTNVRPDGAIIGRMMPTFPEAQGAFEQWNYKPLRGVYDCGFDAATRKFLSENGGNYIEKINGLSYVQFYPGRSVTGREIRIQWGADWHDANVEADYFNMANRVGLMAYDDDTFSNIDVILNTWGEAAKDRRLINSFTVSLPDPYSIPPSQKATGILNIKDAYLGSLNAAIDGISTTGTWSILETEV
ncbi:tail sheath protein [Vibrio phage 1.123.O._10N.286.48.F3]|nr:tail sheath protein [Vibrio phage 1.123.O._10N.286.48.F3]